MKREESNDDNEWDHSFSVKKSENGKARSRQLPKRELLLHPSSIN
jgi:hypothetical protein